MITLTLSSGCLGSLADENFFDEWAIFVATYLEPETGLEIEVDQFRFGETGEDKISGADEEERETLLRWLKYDGWEKFCATESYSE